jgi:hypothetical protein
MKNIQLILFIILLGCMVFTSRKTNESFKYTFPIGGKDGPTLEVNNSDVIDFINGMIPDNKKYGKFTIDEFDKVVKAIHALFKNSSNLPEKLKRVLATVGDESYQNKYQWFTATLNNMKALFESENNRGSTNSSADSENTDKDSQDLQKEFVKKPFINLQVKKPFR